MSNLIDRAQAMMELQMHAKRITLAYEAHGEGHVKFSDDIIKISDAANVLRDLPTITAERKRGRFVGTEFDGYADGNPVFYEWECSECRCVFEEDEPTYNYCPNCGAYMGEKGEE